MSPHIALLRAVNVGGRKVLKDDLLGLAKDLGFDDAKTLLASGNLVLWGKGGPHKSDADADIERRLEDGLEKRMGLRTDFMVRSPAELKAIIAANPFPDLVEARPSHLVVNFLKHPIPAADVEVLRAAITGRERVEGGGKELYVDFIDGIGESMLDRDWKKTKKAPVGTARNWNTVMKLAAMAGI
ncbi:MULTISPECIES: DUF1697 domain-containing protein [unclassified Caulobacter]|uniref:DUF1697 domain-containing protein n=1 Tax=unclassified Caulobacter TaxID=2648921 RepID=UPI000A662664|nr:MULTISPECIES: DUF1697 domain-containing protein [unclassified Caulobacter]